MNKAQLIMLLSAAVLLAGCASSGSTTAPVAEASTETQVSESTAADNRIFSMPYLMRELDNGLKVMVVQTPYPDVVTLQIPVQTGSRNEIEPGKSGFAHFFEHMMFRGTENISSEEYASTLKNAGADQNAYTTDDYTNYYINFTRADLETVLKLEADRFMNLSYSEEDFRTEAQAVKGEYLKNYSNPVQKMFERIRDIAYQNHTYKHTTMGFFKDIEDMPNQMEYSEVFFDRWYRPEKAAVILVGDVDPEQTFELVKQNFGPWEGGDYDIEIPRDEPQTAPAYDHVQWEAPTQPWLLVAYHGPATERNSTDYPALNIAADLYFGQTSDVYKKVVNTDQSADQFFSYFPTRKDPALIYFGARLTDVANAEKVLTDIMDTLVRMRTEKVDDKKLQETKSALRYGFAGGMDNSTSIGSILTSYVQFDRDPEFINDLYARYDELTPDHLIDAANRYLKDSNRVALSLSNDESMSAASAIRDIDAEVADIANRKAADIELVEMKSNADLVNVSLLFNAGPASDPAGKHGLAALTAQMITEGGSAAMTIDEINKALYPMAAGFGNQVDKEMTRFSGGVHKDNLDDWYALVGNMLLNPGWREDDFDRLKTQQLNAIRTDLRGNNDEELGKEQLYLDLYGPDHPYGYLNLGDVSELEAITLDDVKAFYREHYTQQALTVGLAGGYSDAFRDRLMKDLSNLPVGEAGSAEIPAAPALSGRAATIIQKETPAVAVSFGFPIDIRRGDDDWVALWLARSWLGEHRSTNSYLYQRIREVRGMNYGDYAYIEYFPRGMFRSMPNANIGRQQQIFQIWIRPLRSNNDAHFATRAALYELDKLISDGMTEEDFNATRNFLDKYVSLLASSQFRQLGYALDSEYYGVDRFADYIREALATMTVDVVNRAIRNHLQTENMQYVFISSDAEDLQSRLVGNTLSKLEYNTDKPQELLDEDALIEILDLGLDKDSVTIRPIETIFD